MRRRRPASGCHGGGGGSPSAPARRSREVGAEGTGAASVPGGSVALRPGSRDPRLDPAGLAAPAEEPLRVALVGGPNVGKSALFGRLTGTYVTVSNYPGTSVEVARGRGSLPRTDSGPGAPDGDEPSGPPARPGPAARRALPPEAEFLDTPGLYSLLATTEEERVARRILLGGEADVLVHVVEARNLDRALPLTLQLLELGRPLVLALNMMDEAARSGLAIDPGRLAERLGAEAVPTVAISGRGVDELRAAVVRAARSPWETPAPAYGNGVGEALDRIEAALAGDYPVSRRALAALLFQEDEEARATVVRREPGRGLRAHTAVLEATGDLDTPPAYRLAVERRRRAEELAREAVTARPGRRRRLSSRLSRLLTHPVTGVPVLAAVLWLGLYQFVGVFGAGTLVDWLEGALFESRINPFLEGLFAGVGWGWLRDLAVGEYGVLTLGLRYAVAIILPIVGTFFLFFSVLEDSGYFPRLALLVDRVFKRLGLNGRAVIPIVLGFACDTMATMVTRTLETRRERVLSTLLLALAIPCSAQLGVILAVLAGQPAALAVWGLAVLGTFLLVGAVAARLLPGESGSFYMELPPLRRPRLRNVATKTLTRMHWYFLEVLPLFLLASVLLWAGELTGLLGRVLDGLGPVVAVLGLPDGAASVLLFGFFRRDYGAAGLFDLNAAGALDPVQLTVAAVTLTLFVPCIAQFLMMLKERGARTATAMLAFATGYALAVGLLLRLALRGVGW